MMGFLCTLHSLGLATIGCYLYPKTLRLRRKCQGMSYLDPRHQLPKCRELGTRNKIGQPSISHQDVDETVEKG